MRAASLGAACLIAALAATLPLGTVYEGHDMTTTPPEPDPTEEPKKPPKDGDRKPYDEGH